MQNVGEDYVISQMAGLNHGDLRVNELGKECRVDDKADQLDLSRKLLESSSAPTSWVSI